MTKDDIEKFKPHIIQKYLADKSIDDSKLSKKDLIFDFNDPFMRRWDGLILILAIWSGIMIPFKVAFKPPLIFPIEIFEAVMYWFFIMDIFV